MLSTTMRQVTEQWRITCDMHMAAGNIFRHAAPISSGSKTLTCFRKLKLKVAFLILSTTASTPTAACSMMPTHCCFPHGYKIQPKYGPHLRDNLYSTTLFGTPTWSMSDNRVKPSVQQTAKNGGKLQCNESRVWAVRLNGHHWSLFAVN